MRALLIALLVLTCSCSKRQTTEKVDERCLLAAFLLADYPAYRELSCAGDGGPCVLDVVSTGDVASFYCDGVRIVPLASSGPELPCIAPSIEDIGGNRGWMVFLNMVSVRKQDGGVSGHSVMGYAGEGRELQIRAADLPNVRPSKIPTNDYVHRVLVSGIAECVLRSRSGRNHSFCPPSSGRSRT